MSTISPFFMLGKQLMAWAQKQGLKYLDELTAGMLSKFRVSWSKDLGNGQNTARRKRRVASPSAQLIRTWLAEGPFTWLISTEIIREYKAVLSRLGVRPQLAGRIIDLPCEEAEEVDVLDWLVAVHLRSLWAPKLSELICRFCIAFTPGLIYFKA